ncbi:hydantoinase/oxoprolinase family protein, partial [Natronomonas sp.]|uniref:hydantoinase/oxoprolinase family protein n=1 Tax=Natronomonas sp. TaxID=2184060 RepID=UPI003975E2F3
MSSTPNQSDIRIGVDVGGTNTDVLLVDGTETHTYKVPTTDDPSESTVQGVAEVCEEADVDPGSVGQILHGTTVATNALIEYEGATTGMLTTAGFRDVIHIGRHRKPHNFSLQQTVPWQERPIVERRHRKEIPERIQPPGETVTPLDEDAVLEATAELVADGVESVAVCYLHSYIDPTHERRTKELIEAEFPELSVSTSSGVVAQFREFERFTTTAINARLEPVMSTYLERLRDQLTDRGFDSEVLVMQSNGGLASLEQVRRMPVTTLVSGPAAGVLSAEFEGQHASEDRLIALDMGGTSADISVYPGRVLERDPRDSKVGGYPTIVPMLDIETIGSGGGSIAWLDRAKGFNVGPKSAGADPGPACYDRGNDQPTVTDAQVVLGRIDPETFLGGDLDIKPARSREAIRKYLCDPLDQERFATPERAALAVLELATVNMYRAIREQTVQRGYDPREYTMVAFGGAGPMHAADIADELDASKVLVPPSPGIASARGLLTADVQYDYQVTLSRDITDVDGDTVDERFDELERRGREQLERDEIPPETMAFERSVDCLYEGQGYELNVAFDGTDGDWQQRIRERFEAKHEAEYGHYFEADPVELLNLRVSSV